ncbi:hypothetical protein [Clostridium sp. C2-6-12]|nr:hypothetical protein [Clostridium sp. C2-6-12]
MDINPRESGEIIDDTYYSKIAEFNLRTAKDLFTIPLMMIIN